ncbi:LysR family substrate-binding domain-containing protein [Alloacidobacterium dinghuense]|uniref:LysR family substrate-binding domain-containing protein n=1 Tax=Alloacidobacterium dinghuense TaxID=2763107 RepID=A0A7G8BNT1_9BACT|nr:LysR family substrate-binding domain-containing protein [Alloacidobacterium dinghuense]QNI34201.1 LysR family substrate-binding domain-containing protein [Alloacidobacterium dinghuense]
MSLLTMPSSAPNCCIRTQWWRYFPQIIRSRVGLRLRDLADERFVVCDRDIAPTFFDKITSLCAQAGFSPNIVQASNLVSSVLTLVEAGEGVTLLPSGLQLRQFSDLSFCPLIDPGAASTWSWRGLQIAKEKRTNLFLISCAARRNSSEAHVLDHLEKCKRVPSVRAAFEGEIRARKRGKYWHYQFEHNGVPYWGSTRETVKSKADTLPKGKI